MNRIKVGNFVEAKEDENTKGGARFGHLAGMGNRHRNKKRGKFRDRKWEEFSLSQACLCNEKNVSWPLSPVMGLFVSCSFLRGAICVQLPEEWTG